MCLHGSWCKLARDLTQCLILTRYNMSCALCFFFSTLSVRSYLSNRLLTFNSYLILLFNRKLELRQNAQGKPATAVATETPWSWPFTPELSFEGLTLALIECLPARQCYACSCRYMWRPEADVWMLSSATSPLYFSRSSFSLNLGLTTSARWFHPPLSSSPGVTGKLHHTQLFCVC